MIGIVSCNGDISDLKDAKISILDRGLLYGDGIFEGIRFVNKKILFHKEHLNRFYSSAKKISLPMFSEQEYEQQLFAAVRASGWDTGYLRVIATRGVGKMGILPDLNAKPNLYIIVTTIELYPEEKYQTGAKLIISTKRKIPKESFDCSIKSLCYLPNITAMHEAIEQGADEAIMLGIDGYVSEATVDNIFGVTKGVLFTPSLDTNCLAGITRDKIIEIGREQGLKILEGRFLAQEFINAEEVFLTGTGAGIVPVVEIDGASISGGVGEITKSLRRQYESELESYCTSIEIRGSE